MRIFATLAAASMALALSCSAAQMTGYIACSTYNLSGTPYLATGHSEGIITCGGAGIAGTLSSISGQLFFSDTFANGNIATIPNYTQTVFSGITLGAVASDAVTATGGVSSSSYADSQGLANNNAILGRSFFIDGLTLTGTQANTGFTFNYSTAYSGGTAVGGTAATGGVVGVDDGAVYVQYTYTTSTGTPEPVSTNLFGSGLLAVSLFGRKKFASK